MSSVTITFVSNDMAKAGESVRVSLAKADIYKSKKRRSSFDFWSIPRKHASLIHNYIAGSMGSAEVIYRAMEEAK